MRSCLRRPLAPGKSRVRAILVSSVMFFSLSSAIVMVSPTGVFLITGQDCLRIRGENYPLRRIPEGPARQPGPAGFFRESLLCSATLWFCNLFAGQFDDRIDFVGIANAHQHIIHGFLDARVGLMKLTRRLGK